MTNPVTADGSVQSRLKAVIDGCPMITDFTVTKTFKSRELGDPVEFNYYIEIEGWTTEGQLPEEYAE